MKIALKSAIFLYNIDMTKTKTEKTKFDLGSKNVRRTFLTILIPTLIAQVIAGTFVIFDTFFVSHGFQATAIFEGLGTLNAPDASYASLGPAAISYAMPYTFFIIGLGLAIGAGLSSIMTKQLANDDKVGMQNTMDSFLPMSVFYGVIMMVVLLLGAKVFVWLGSGFQKDYLTAWFNNPLLNSNWASDMSSEEITEATYKAINGHILSQAAWYLRIQALGCIPYIYMSGGVIMLRVQGKAQYATSFSAVGLVTNIILDFLFIMVLKMNVVGAAIATVIGQYATAAVYWYYFKYRADIKANSFNMKHSMSLLKETFVSGVSIMMLQVLTGVTLIMFTFSIGVTNYGQMYAVTNYTAVYQGYNALFIFCNLIIIAAAQSMKPIVEFNYVKGDIENVKKARNWGYGFAMIFALIVTVFIVAFSEKFIGAFYSVQGGKDFITSGWVASQTGAAAEVNTNGMDVASTITRLLFISFPLAAFIQMNGTYIQGMGQDTRASIMLFGKLALLFPLILFFGFAMPWAVKATWDFGGAEETYSILDTNAELGMFLALPITDLIIGSLAIFFMVDAQRKLLSPKTKENIK